MKDIDIIASSSSGNCYKYFNILVDVGISYERIRKYLNKINLVILTHQHVDHFKPSVIRNIANQHKHIKFAVPDYMIELVKDFIPKSRIHVLERSKIYNFPHFIIQPFKLYHDVPNNGYILEFKRVEGQWGNYRIFHATDTAHLKGIKPPKCDVYVVECNYSQSKYDALYERVNNSLWEEENAKELREKLRIFTNSTNTHMSDLQFNNFKVLYVPKTSTIIGAHKSSERL